MTDWIVSNDAHYLFSEDFGVDVSLAISGDFRDREHRRQYAQMLARKLNCATDTKIDAEPQGVRLTEAQFEALAHWVRTEAVSAATPWPQIKPDTETAKHAARLAFGLPETKEN